MAAASIISCREHCPSGDCPGDRRAHGTGPHDGEENLNIGAYIRNDRAGVRRDIEMIYGYFPKLKMLRRKLSGYLSGGEQQTLVIGRGHDVKPQTHALGRTIDGIGAFVDTGDIQHSEASQWAKQDVILVVEQNARLALSQAMAM